MLPPWVLKNVDIHGSGEEEHLDTLGLLHGVTTKENDCECYEENIKPDGQQCTELSQQFRNIEYKDVYGNTVSS